MPFLSLEAPIIFYNFGTPCRSYESLSKLGALTVRCYLSKSYKFQRSKLQNFETLKFFNMEKRMRIYNVG